ncbi:MAG: hypothetical protein ACREL6_01795 [Gemmatimonadales bacterium]
MKATLTAAGLFLATGLIVQPAEAQRVSADIIIGNGPVAGRVIVGRPHIRHHGRRVVVVDRFAPRRYVVHRYRVKHVGRGHAYGHVRGLRYLPGYHPIRVYYDVRGDRYYDHRRPGLREVVLYERGGRYYRDWDDRHDRWYDDDDYRDRDRDYDRRDRYDD